MTLKGISHIFLITIFVCLFSCTTYINTVKEKEFLDKFSKEDFSGFIGRELLARGVNQEGNVIIFNMGMDNDTRCSAPYIVHFDRNKKKVTQTSRNLIADSCKIDEDLLLHQATRFAELRIWKLYVGSDSSVSVFFEIDKPASLVKIPDQRKMNGYKNIRDNWYKPIK